MMSNKMDFGIPIVLQLLAGLLILLLNTSNAWAAVNARLERSQVYEGEQVALNIEADGRLQGVQPDLSPLEQGFRVLGTSTSQEVRIINGQRSDKTKWMVQLQPKRLGRIEIPAISVAGESTKPIALEVREVPEQVANQRRQQMFLEVEVEPADRSPHVQEQIRYTVRLFYDLALLNGDLSDPKPEHAVVERLTKDRRYRANRNGRQYRVIERSYAIYPERSGELRMPPVRFDGRMASAHPGQRRDSTGSLLERFLGRDAGLMQGFGGSLLTDDIFSLSPFGDRGRPVSVRSKSIVLDVAARPKDYTGRYWLPARALKLYDSWVDNPPKLTAGEPVTRTITIEATGLEASQIPQLELSVPAGVHLYPEQPDTNNRTDGQWIFGSSRQRFTYVSSAPGQLSLPAVDLTWWDTRADQIRTASLPAWQLQVAPGQLVVSKDSSPAAADPESQGVGDAPSAAQHQPQQAGSALVSPVLNHWPWALAGLLLLAALLMVVLRLYRSRPLVSGSSSRETIAPKPDRRALLEVLDRACQKHDPHSAAKALIELGACLWSEQSPRNLGAFASRLGAGDQEVGKLDRALYAPDPSDWDGSALLEAVEQGIEAHSAASINAPEEALEPLYPQRAIRQS